MNTMKLVLNVIMIFSMIACEDGKESQLNKHSEAKIKRKLIYGSIADTIPLAIHEYQYDNEMKLEKIWYCSRNCTDMPYKYELFKYSGNEIVNKITYYYANDSLGWLLQDSTHYSYENGKIILEEKFYFVDRTLYYKDHIEYVYEDSKLKKKYVYSHKHFEHYIDYEYSGSFCIKETIFQDSLGTKMYSYTNHYYENDKLVKSERFSNNGLIQVIIYTYDEKGNLIIEESKKVNPDVVAMLDYVYRYEYYEFGN